MSSTTTLAGPDLSEPPIEGRERLRALLRRYGSETVSFHALEQEVRVWHDTSGAVGYLDTGHAWVTTGAPIAPIDLRSLVARNFVHTARQNRRRVCFCAVEDQFDREGQFASLQVGAQPFWDPTGWSRKLSEPSARRLREQLRRARSKQVDVRALDPSELLPGSRMRLAIGELLQRWNEMRRTRPLRFLLDVELFARAEERRIYAASVGDRLVGVLGAVPIYGRSGWFFKDILRDPDAPNGTAELLIDAAMTSVASERCRYVTLGLVPLVGDVPGWLRMAEKCSATLYDFRGLLRFREKLWPDGWEPVFIRYPRGQTALSTLWDALTALAGGSPIAWAAKGLALPRAKALR